MWEGHRGWGMLLRRLVDALRAQNWTAIWIEFLLLVTGVFLGIQAANWNQARVDRARERLLLGDLRAEVAESMRQTQIRERAFTQVAASGRRAIAFLDAGQPCAERCWPVLVDFFHASQWQVPAIGLPTYDEMRRNGWPRQREIVEAVERYLRQGVHATFPVSQPPAYRSLVRGLIPLAIHEPYWRNCFALAHGEETYVDPCPEGVPPAVSAAAVAAIVAHPEIRPTLTDWTGFNVGYSAALRGQNDAAQRALALIDAELARDG